MISENEQPAYFEQTVVCVDDIHSNTGRAGAFDIGSRMAMQ